MTTSDGERISHAELPEVRLLGRYRLRYRVGRGGMASVYLAQMRGTERFQKWVAVKVVHEHIQDDASLVALFQDEARLAARIDHPNVCHVLDFGCEHGTWYLAMEYLHGEPLSAVIKRAWNRGRLRPELAARILADAARGLHGAHELKLADGRPAEVVHRDISPQNLFVLYDGATKVVDFGIARSRDRTAAMTASDVLRGKLAYMAPEQIRRQHPLDRRIDIFALGVVLWEACVGERLFKAPNEIETILAVCDRPIPRPSELRPDFPLALEAVILRALERDRSLRYATAGEMARDLERFLVSTGVPVGPDEVADEMRVLFSEQIAKREALLNRPEDDAGPVPDVELHAPSNSTASALARGAVEQPGTPTEPDSSTRSERRARVGATNGSTDTPSTEDETAIEGMAQASTGTAFDATLLAHPEQRATKTTTRSRSRVYFALAALSMLLTAIAIAAMHARPTRRDNPPTRTTAPAASPEARAPIVANALPTAEPTSVPIPSVVDASATSADVSARAESSPRPHEPRSGNAHGTGRTTTSPNGHSDRIVPEINGTL